MWPATRTHTRSSLERRSLESITTTPVISRGNPPSNLSLNRGATLTSDAAQRDAAQRKESVSLNITHRTSGFSRHPQTGVPGPRDCSGGLPRRRQGTVSPLRRIRLERVKLIAFKALEFGSAGWAQNGLHAPVALRAPIHFAPPLFRHNKRLEQSFPRMVMMAVERIVERNSVALAKRFS